MSNNSRRYYLDYNEKEQQWHIDLERLPENDGWVNIGYSNHMVLSHFCDVIDMMDIEFGIKFTTAQVNRLAECIPGITIYRPTPVPDGERDYNNHMAPIETRQMLEEHIEWKSEED